MYKLFLIALICPVILFAQEKPSQAEIKKVINYYYNGTGVALGDYAICEKVESNMPVGITEPGALKANTTYMFWMAYLVPQNQEAQNVIIQYNQGGITRKTKNVSVSSSIRYRTWAGLTLSAGTWEVVVIHDKGDAGIEKLATINCVVTD